MGKIARRRISDTDKEVKLHVGIKGISKRLQQPYWRCRGWILDGVVPTRRVGNFYVASEAMLRSFEENFGEVADAK